RVLVPREHRPHGHVHVLGAADVLRRLDRRLVGTGVVGHAVADARSGLVVRRRRHLDARDRRARARRRRARRRRRGTARPRRETAHMTARLLAAFVALGAGVAAVIVVALLLHATPGPQ